MCSSVDKLPARQYRMNHTSHPYLSGSLGTTEGRHFEPQLFPSSRLLNIGSDMETGLLLHPRLARIRSSLPETAEPDPMSRESSHRRADRQRLSKELDSRCPRSVAE